MPLIFRHWPACPRALMVLMPTLLSACGGGDESSSSEIDDSESTAGLSEAYILQTGEPAPSCFEADEEDLAFTNVTLSIGLCFEGPESTADDPVKGQYGGIATGDYNKDGVLDLYISLGRSAPGRLFKGTGTGSYKDVTHSSGITPRSPDASAQFFDIDEDNDLDLVSMQPGPKPLQMFGNNGDGTFTDISSSIDLPLTKQTLSFGASDYDLDGDLDLFFSHWGTDHDKDPMQHLWQNQGNGSYLDVSENVEIIPFLRPSSGILSENSFMPLFVDFDHDNYPDVLLVSDNFSTQVLRNASGGGFFDITNAEEITDESGMGTDLADYDGDGDLDWFVSAIFREPPDPYSEVTSGNRLYRNDGNGFYTDVTDQAGVRNSGWGWGSCFADFNNDSLPDIYVVNGFYVVSEETGNIIENRLEEYHHDLARMYINNGDGTFTERSEELGVADSGQGRGLLCYDYDRDGDVDMLIANHLSAPTLYRNNNFGQDNNFINIRLWDANSNPQDAIGARILAKKGDKQWVSEITNITSYLTQSPLEVHFGLGQTEQLDSLRVEWAGPNAEVTELTDIDANQFITITKP